MPRLPGPITARLKELREALGIIRVGAPSILETFLPEFGSLVSSRGCAYGVRVEEEEYEISFCHVSGVEAARVQATMKTIADVVRAPKRQLGFYTPARIERWQRNRAIAFPRNSEVLRMAAALPGPLATQRRSFEASSKQAYESAFAKLGVTDDCQLRVLVCSGPSLLAWIGAFRHEPFGAQDRRILQGLAPALQRRLAMERQWEDATFSAEAVPVLLENIPGAALIVNASGRIGHANAVAAALLERDARGLREKIGDALRGAPLPPFMQLTRISASGWPACYLVVLNNEKDPFGRVKLARQRWGLTQREAEILAHLASGAPNKTISALTDCAVRTVEQHVTLILAKLQVENRAAAIARFWSEL